MLIEQTWYAKEFINDFDKLWVLNDDQLEKLDVSFGADILAQLENINNPDTSKDD